MASEPGEYDTAIRIGRLHTQLGDALGAAQYHRRALQEAVRAGAPKGELSKLWLWLAKWEMRREREARRVGGGRWGEEGDLESAREWLERAAEVTEDKEVSAHIRE